MSHDKSNCLDVIENVNTIGSVVVSFEQMKNILSPKEQKIDESWSQVANKVSATFVDDE